jgi:hypothetical protein
MRLCKVLLAVGIIALVATPALAQRGRGGFGFGGLNRFDQLVANKSVQDELKMDKDQVTKSDEAIKKLRDGDLKDEFAKVTPGRRGGGGGTPPTPEERAAASKKVNEAVEKALKDVLKDDQMKRLGQIRFQQMGLALFTDEDAQKALKLTDEQKTKIKAINEDLAKERRELFPQGQKPADDAFTKLQSLTKEAEANAAKALTDDQKKTLKEMKGEAFEIKIERRGGGQPGKPRTDF